MLLGAAEHAHRTTRCPTVPLACLPPALVAAPLPDRVEGEQSPSAEGREVARLPSAIDWLLLLDPNRAAQLSPSPLSRGWPDQAKLAMAGLGAPLVGPSLAGCARRGGKLGHCHRANGCTLPSSSLSHLYRRRPRSATLCIQCPSISCVSKLYALAGQNLDSAQHCFA